MNGRSIWSVGLVVVLSLAAVGSVNATPFGDSYFLQLQNFPVNLGPLPLTFNNPGDFTPEGNPAIIQVVERSTGVVGPNGGEELQFRFDFGTFPGDPNAIFAFRISELSWGGGQVGELASSTISVNFGTSSLGPVSSDMLVTGSVDMNGLTMLFQSPLSWVQIVGQNPTPTDVVFDFFPEIVTTPEPATSMILGFGLVLSLGVLRRRS